MSSATQRTHTTENTRPTSFEVSTLQTQTLRIATMCHNTPFNQRFCLLHGIGSFNQRASARHTSEMRFTTVFKCGQLSFYFKQLSCSGWCVLGCFHAYFRQWNCGCIDRWTCPTSAQIRRDNHHDDTWFFQCCIWFS